MPTLSAHKKGILAIILANLIWGAAPPVFKLALENIPPFTLAFIRFYGAMLMLFPFILRKPWIKLADWPALIVTALFGITMNIAFFFYGLEKSSSINASIIASAGPIFIYILSVFFLHERLNKKVLIGTGVSLIGVLLIVSEPFSTGLSTGEIMGNLFFLIATLGSVGYTIIGKRIMKTYDANTITFWMFFISSLTFLPFFLNELITHHPFVTIDYRGWTGIGFGVIFSSFAAYTLCNWGLSKMHAQEIGVFSYIDPIITTVIAIPLLGEAISPLFALAAVLVFLGVYIAEGRIQYHPIHKLFQSTHLALLDEHGKR